MNDYGNIFANNGTGFVGFVRDGKIYNSNGQQVGYINDEYNKAMQVARDYEKILYDKGILTKPKTPEEINQELQSALSKTQEMMATMASTITALNDKVQKLEGDKNGQKFRNGDSEQIHGTGEQPEIEQGV